jgi:two-component system, sensor histidine kinase and response regulator
MFLMATQEQADTDMMTSPTARVLIVDDDTTSRYLLGQILQEHYQIINAMDGAEALDVLNTQAIDVVLLDIMMPVMNGFEVLERIRSQDSTTNIPVIMVTAKHGSADIVRALNLGANDYITKPIDINMVLARVKTQVTVKRLIDEREQAIVRLRSVQEMRDRLFRVAAHDLKNPLANIRMVEYMLHDLVPEDETVSKVMETFQLSLDAMEQVLADFLDVVVLQSGKLDLKTRCLALDAVIYNQVLQYSVHAQQKTIELRLGDVSGAALADESRLGQVVSNLVSNAIKYSPRGTTVSIWTEAAGNFVRLNVADQGPGIPEAERYLLFTEFGKLTTRPTAQESSTGLGLWIVKNLVELMGGMVGVDCPPDGGSIFWIELPMC